VIQRVRALAKKSDIEMIPLDVNDAVREAIALVRRALVSHQVSLRTELASPLPMVLGDRVQLQQVMINLVMNGIEAMQSATDRSRELAIRSRHDEIEQVLVGVTDYGAGISAENADHLFNPFFTTESSGMGMGFSISSSIIDAHGGRLWATANLPHGATASVHPAGKCKYCVVRLYAWTVQRTGVRVRSLVRLWVDIVAKVESCIGPNFW
jgi:C4-dicarboxylate-specific signal transduction histidine kinase